MITRSLLFGVALGALPLFAQSAKKIPMPNNVHTFINTYCIDCHGPDQEKGDRAFHQLATQQRDGWVIDTGDPDKIELLKEILDQLNLGEMPPDKKNIKQPKPQQVRNISGWMTRALLRLEQQEATSQTVLRRLNRREYRHTMQDLLQLGELSFDPTQDFPADENEHGFTNIGESLNLSDARLNHYLDAAEAYLDIAFHFGYRPPSQTLRVEPEAWGYPQREETTPWMYRLATPKKFLDIGAGAKQLSSHSGLVTVPHQWSRHGVRHAGYYRISITAEAIRRLTHPYDPDMIPTNLEPQMQLALYVANGREGLSAGGIQARRRLALWDLEDHQTKNFVTTIWLQADAIPFINWDNGPGPSDYWMRDILKKYHTDVEFRGKQGAHAWHVVGKDAVPGRAVSDVWRGPVIRIHDFALTGPLPESYSSSAQHYFLGDTPNATNIQLDQALLKFTRKAFRRPVARSEIIPYIRIAQHARKELGRNAQDALRIAMQAVLVSPDFLYLKERGQESLDAHAVANRLSYLLWSSMPDDALDALADSGELLQPSTLRDQADRMLRDPKSQRFVEGFAEAWLRLDKLGSMPPDTIKFQEYYRYDLEQAMRTETHLFLAHLIRENRPPRECLDCDYTFVNQDLARHYGINGITGSTFRRISLPADSPRGGLTGQASMMTLSANGVDTSPVVRGIWILESILGTPPPPAPPDVEPLDPDVRGTTTIRQRLEKHRTAEACADCHAKIDPFGFPLEHFDPVGGFRETYFRNRRWNRLKVDTIMNPGRPVNGFAKLPSGEMFKNPTDLKRVLLQREDQFLKNLTTKLLTYATGREMTFRDQAQINAIVSRVKNEDMGFRDLILQVVESKTFTTP